MASKQRTSGAFLKPWRSPAFRIQALAMLVAALAMTTMLSLRDTVNDRFSQRTAVALGGDLVLEGTRFPEPAQRELLDTVRHAETVNFASVLIQDDQFLLASVRAVTHNYPLYGELLISDDRFSSPYAAQQAPATGHIWLAGQALDRLGLSVGDSVTLGNLSLNIERVIVQEPDQQSGFYSMNPRALIAVDDLEASGVLGPGSRYKHHVLIAAPAAERESLTERLEPTLRVDQEIETARNTELRQRGPIRQMFLWSQLAVMLVILLCAAAIYLTASHRARQQQTLCAVMKTAGATQRQIASRLLGADALALCLPALAGALLATGIGLWISQTLEAGSHLPAGALVQGLIGPAVLWLGFAAPTLWQQLQRSPLSLLRDEAGSTGQALPLIIAVLAPLPLAALLTGSLASLWPLLLVTLVAAIGLPLLLWPLISGLDRVISKAPLAARLAFRRLSRRKTTTLPLLAALIISLSVLSMSLQTGNQLLGQWRATLPEQAPNYFVINLFDNDIDGFKGWLAQHESAEQPLYPVVRARLTGLNGEPVREAVTKEQDRGTRALNRDLSLTESDSLPDSNTLLEGRFARHAGEVTVESKLAESLGLKVGDALTFTGAAAPFDATITGFREVDWESFAPNFYFIFAPGTLEAQSRTWITSFYLPESEAGALAELVSRYPQISLLDVNAILTTLQEIIRQASTAAFLVGVLLMIAALLVLLAALLSSAAQIGKDNQLLIILGAGHNLLRRTTALQALYLGGGAALLANLIHLAALWPLGQRLFDGALPLSPWMLIPWLAPAILATLAWRLPPLKPAGHQVTRQ